MDPYLQSHWRDVHASLIVYMRDALQESLPGTLRARVEERVVLETPEGIGPNPLYPDLRVIEYRPDERQGGVAAVAEVTAAEAVEVELTSEPPTEGYIEIIDAESGNRVVTVIELLSPTNKMTAVGRVQYCHKQREVCNSGSSLVEIDLIRGGNHILAFPLDHLSVRRQTAYMVCVRRAWVRDKAQVYSIFLSQRLPTIKVPLRQADAEVPLDLQALIEQCYRRGRYEGDLDYRKDADPPLAGAEAEWAEELLRGKGLRPTRPANGKRKRKPPRASGEK
jgi:hypothetical protein